MATVKILEHTIDYWYEDDQKMPRHEQEHVKDMIIDGYNNGQLVDYNNKEGINPGWWKIICPYCEARKGVN